MILDLRGLKKMKLETKLDKLTMVKGECRDLALRIEQDYRLGKIDVQEYQNIENYIVDTYQVPVNMVKGFVMAEKIQYLNFIQGKKEGVKYENN